MIYVVVRLDNQAPHPPKVKHATEEDAKKQAERLATKHPGSCFIVCNILCAFRTSPVPMEITVADIPLMKKPE